MCLKCARVIVGDSRVSCHQTLQESCHVHGCLYITDEETEGWRKHRTCLGSQSYGVLKSERPVGVCDYA